MMLSHSLTNELYLRLLAAVLLVSPAVWPPCTHADETKTNMDANAARALKAVSQRLADAKSLQFESSILFNTVEQQAKEVFEIRMQYFVKRPNRLHVRGLRDDGSQFSVWYDGKAFSTFEPDLNTYSTVDAPDAIDGLMDSLTGDAALPLADLLYSDPFASFTRQLVSGLHRGQRSINGELCDYLSFKTEESHFQIWITVGHTPTPRRFVVNHFNVPGAPQLIADLSNWDLAPKLDDAMFQFKPPKGATRKP